MAIANLLAYFFILLPAIGAESGSGAAVGYDVSTDAEMDTKFTCVTQFPPSNEHFLICNVTGAEETLKGTFVNFTIVREKSSDKCKMESQLGGKCPIKNYDLITELEVCLTVTWMEQQSPQQCQKVMPRHIVKPEAPVGLNITYQEAANEYLILFSTPHLGTYLDGKLIHEIAYRQPNRNWTTREFEHLELKLQGKEFQPGEKYEIRIRSKPNGEFFRGTWSEWSSSKSIQTPNEKSKEEHVFIVASIFGFILLLMISMIPIFWRNRIKPIIWPTLPNHEKTLDKLCDKLRKNSDISFFTPESLGYVHIHKVDSIQAKSEANHFPQSSLPWNVQRSPEWSPGPPDISEKMGNGPEQKNHLIHINHGWLKLPLAYEGMWPAETQHGPLDGRRPANGDACISTDESSAGSCSDTLSTHSGSSTDPTILAGLEVDPCRQNGINFGTRVSNHEEAYVTMASFFQNKGHAGK